MSVDLYHRDKKGRFNATIFIYIALYAIGFVAFYMLRRWKNQLNKYLFNHHDLSHNKFAILEK